MSTVFIVMYEAHGGWANQDESHIDAVFSTWEKAFEYLENMFESSDQDATLDDEEGFLNFTGENGTSYWITSWDMDKED